MVERSGAVVLGVVVLFAAASTLACGGESARKPPDPPEPIDPVDLRGEPARSGERLRAMYWLSEEGLRVPMLRFLDTERSEECAFRRGADGDFRCFPDAVSASFGSDLLDADCRTPVFLACREYAAVVESTGCENGATRLYELGDVIAGKPRMASDCAFSLQTGPGDEYRRIGARISDGKFVRAVTSFGAQSGRIGAEQLSGEDGSGLLLGFYDFDERAPCEPVSFTTDAPQHCLPTPFAPIATYFDDEQCSGEGLPLAVHPCEKPRIGRPSNEEQFYRLGARADVPPFYWFERIGCTPNDGWPGYEVREPVALDSFAAIEVARVGDGRIRMGVARGAEGTPEIPDPVRDQFRLWDEELGLQCSIAKSSDGEYRCLPTIYGTSRTNLFADDRCEIPLAGVSSGTANPDGPVWFVWTTAANEAGCAGDTMTSVYELSEQPFEGPMYIPSSDIDGNPLCVEFTGTYPNTLFAPGPEIAPESFVRFERQAE